MAREITIHVHIDTAQLERKLDELIILKSRLDQLIQIARASLNQERIIMASLDDITADVTAQTDVVSGAVTLLQSLKAELDAAIASGDPSKLQAIADSLQANTQALASAVAANTPADPNPAPVDGGTVSP